jgi:hypothetical protein
MIPAQVRAIARHWGGQDIEPHETDKEGTFGFTSRDGMRYEVTEPGKPFDVYNDSGRPEGTVTRDDWCVRCTTDAPDGWFTVQPNGFYAHSWTGHETWIWMVGPFGIVW